MKNKLCVSFGGHIMFHGISKRTQLIELRQQGRDRFSVRYGMQLKTGLDYNQAAIELGAALMHHAACEGKLDNRE